MGGEQKVANLTTGISFREEIAQGEEVPERFRHLLAFDHKVGAMEPVLNEFLSRRLDGCAFALRNFILMVWKHQIFPADVNIKARPEEFHAHRAALDVPTGPAFAPGTGPKDGTVFGHTLFPERKIGNGFL